MRWQMKTVFVHGWGGDAHYWQDLVPLLSFEEPEFVELGFTGLAPSMPSIGDEKAVFVTHSLGTLFALKNYQKNIAGLISINGFTAFKDFTDERVLKAMQLGLKKDPLKQMQRFYLSADMKPSKDLDAERLEEGLEWLKSWDQRAAFETLQDHAVPILAIVGEQDKIVPIKAVKEQLGNVTAHEQAGHNIAQQYPQWCAEQIKRFVKEELNGWKLATTGR